MFDFITIGGATRDIFFTYKNLKKVRDKESISGHYLMVPYGEKMVSDKAFYSYGGGALNSAICISGLGGKVATLCSVGIEGTGDLICKKLKEEEVSTSLIRRDPIHHTGLSVLILGKDKEHTGFLERGANDFLKIKRKTDLGKTRWLYISSLTGSSEKILPEVFDYAKKRNKKIAFNPGSQQIKKGARWLRKYFSQSEILLLNMKEAESILEKTSKEKPKNIDDLLFKIEKLGATISVVTDGERGAYAISEGKIYYQEAIKAKVVDTTGAGDSFGSTFAFAISIKGSIQVSLKLAATQSSLVVRTMGANEGLLNMEKERENAYWEEFKIHSRA